MKMKLKLVLNKFQKEEYLKLSINMQNSKRILSKKSKLRFLFKVGTE